MAQVAKLVLVNSAVLLLLVTLVEGFAGYALIAYRFTSYDRPDPDRVWSEYDSELGWINRRSVRIADRWGPGIHLTTNAQRFRSLRDFDIAVPPGKTRIVCSGDSFTLGFGVGDEYPWCQRLSALDDRLETVNLGHGGWGVDQAYLWYKRNESTLRHDVHLFAFIADDFRRLELRSFRGFGKPYLTISDGTLIQENNPASRSGYYLPRLMAVGQAFADLNTVDVARRIARRIPQGVDGHGQSRAVVSRIFADLHRSSQAENRLLVFVYLPIFEDNLKDARSATEAWREFVHAESETNGYHLIDVIEEFRKFPADSIPGQYRLHADGHYSVAGNQRVAEIVHRELMRIVSFPRLPSAQQAPVVRMPGSQAR